MVITYHSASTKEELNQILELQQTNLISNVSETEKQKEGFVTVHHQFHVLEAMNNTCAHTIAKYDDNVIGYALSMTKAFRNDVEILKPMFQQIDIATKPNLNYIVMGQICIDKNFRGKGVFKGLYNYMKHQMQYKFDAIITLIDVKNPRSINAHKSAGFRLLNNFSQGNKSLDLVILEI